MGGAIYFLAFDNNHLRLDNCTLIGNSADVGGGIYHNGVTGTTTLEIFNSTITDNTSGSGTIANYSGVSSSQTRTVIYNSILSQNAGSQLQTITPPNGGLPLIFSAGYNLASDDGTGLLDNTGDLINTDPKLLPAALNGGTTPSRLPAKDSPIIDRGSCFLSDTYRDQRALDRPFDVATANNAQEGCDIGAVEWTDRNDDGEDDGEIVFKNGFD